MPKMVRWIWILVAVHLAAGAIAFVHFLVTGQYTLLRFYFGIESRPFFLMMTAAECILAFACCTWFESDEPMHLAWTTIAWAALARVVGTLMHVFSETPLPWNTWSWLHAQPFGPFASLGEVGSIVGSPLSMALLSVGLWRILRIQRKFHLLAVLTRGDQTLLALILAFTLCQVVRIVSLFGSHPHLGTVLLWASDPLLSLLLVEAVLVRRSVLRMGGGLVARCSGMYVLGIVMTSAGDAAMWANDHGMLPPALTVLSWYIWFVAAAAFASAPAYQLAAIAVTCEEPVHALDQFDGRIALPPIAH